MADGQARFEITIMPWAGISGPLEIGAVTIWPASELETRITDHQLRKHLQTYFSSFVDNRRKPVDTILVCSQGAIECRQLTDQERDDIRYAVDALIFATIAPATAAAVENADQRWLTPPSTDRYELKTLYFMPGIPEISIRAGNILHGGWKLGEVKFERPWITGGSFAIPDRSLLDALGRVLSDATPRAFRQRVRRALEWFRLAHTDTEQISPYSKVVMMTTAFEILLEVPQNNKRAEFTSRLHDLCATQETPVATRNGKAFSMVSWWAWEFYNLRNKIVHGDSITLDSLVDQPSDGIDSGLPHLTIADLMMLESLTKKLAEHNCFHRDADEPEEDGQLQHEVVIALMMADLRRTHRAIGWLAKPAGTL